METLFQEYEPEKPILSIGQYALVKFNKPDKKKRGITNKRQYALKEIQDIIESEQGGKMNKNQVKLLAIKLSHIPTEDLYFLKSEGLDYKKRKGEPFGKFVYGAIKVKNI